MFKLNIIFSNFDTQFIDIKLIPFVYMSRRKKDQSKTSLENASEKLEAVSRILGAFNDAIFEHEQFGRPLPPVPIHGDKSEFDYVGYHSDFKNLPEGCKASSSKKIVQIITITENSYFAVSAESFISKYWRSLWPDARAACSEVLSGLCSASGNCNREMLYRLLLKIQKGSKADSKKSSVFAIDDLLPHVVRDIEAANQCVPLDTKGLPDFITATLPQASEHIVCALALECLVHRVEEDSKLRLDLLDIPMISRKSLERILLVISHRNKFPDSNKGDCAYNRNLIRKIESLMR